MQLIMFPLNQKLRTRKAPQHIRVANFTTLHTFHEGASFNKFFALSYAFISRWQSRWEFCISHLHTRYDCGSHTGMKWRNRAGRDAVKIDYFAVRVWKYYITKTALLNYWKEREQEEREFADVRKHFEPKSLKRCTGQLIPRGWKTAKFQNEVSVKRNLNFQILSLPFCLL